jgi:hypothetical protein
MRAQGANNLTGIADAIAETHAACARAQQPGQPSSIRVFLSSSSPNCIKPRTSSPASLIFGRRLLKVLPHEGWQLKPALRANTRLPAGRCELRSTIQCTVWRN